MGTVVSRERLGLVTVDGADYAIADIGLRMLTPRELYRAQGFPRTTSSTAASAGRTAEGRTGSRGNSVSFADGARWSRRNVGRSATSASRRRPHEHRATSSAGRRAGIWVQLGRFPGRTARTSNIVCSAATTAAAPCVETGGSSPSSRAPRSLVAFPARARRPAFAAEGIAA